MIKLFSLNILLLFIWLTPVFPAQAPTLSFLEGHQRQTNGASPLKLRISVEQQLMYVLKNQSVIINYPVSTSKYGLGNKQDSNKTPIGIHEIKDKIGKETPIGTIFRARINTGRKAEILKAPIDKEEDLVTSRIMRLGGLEPGKNKGPGIDSYNRNIYIHGTPEEGLIGTKASHGCIRMKNRDVVKLFKLVNEGTKVVIGE